MRAAVVLLTVLSYTASSRAFQVPFLSSFRAQSHHDNSTVHRVGIIGAGAGGSSAAFWLSRAAERSGLNLSIDVFEKSSYVGGRSTIVYPHGDESLPPVELGASIFVEVNKNLWRAVKEFNHTLYRFGEGSKQVGFWDGDKFVFTMSEGTWYKDWWAKARIWWKYGKAPLTTQKLVKQTVDDFLNLYNQDAPTWRNVSSLAEDLGMAPLVALTTREYLDVEGVSKAFSGEFVEAMTRVNYGQNIDEIHALGGMVSLAPQGASSVQGGNFQLFEGFLNASIARVHLNSHVTKIRKRTKLLSSAISWDLTESGAPNTTQTFDSVILAAPVHNAQLDIHPDPAAKSPLAVSYVQLHVTLVTTVSPSPLPAYFGLSSDSNVPTTILTTSHGGTLAQPEFNSLSYLGQSRPGEWIVKIFSKQAISDEWLAGVFGDRRVTWVYRKTWDAYPRLQTRIDFPSTQPLPNLYYVNAFEPLISTMETETISARNIVDLLLKEQFGTSICGKAVRDASDSKSEGVYGWDC